MALPALMSGADCGPSNPLQSLSKQFERDRGAQQDQFGAGRAGPSREVFRTQSALPSGLEQEAARFFSGQSSPGATFVPQHAPNAFDLSALRGSLPQQQQRPPQPSSSSSAWASDFLGHQGAQSINSVPHLEPNQLISNNSDTNRLEMQPNAYLSPTNPSYFPGLFAPSMRATPMFREAPYPDLVRQQSDAATAAIHAHFPPEETVIRKQQSDPLEAPVDADELARTAGLLIESVKDEVNPKFQNSAFLGLMRQLRDREMVVEGSDMVQASTVVRGEPSGTNQVPIESRAGQSFVPSQSDPAALEQREIRRAYGELVSQAMEARINEQRAATQSTPRKSVHFDRPEAIEPGMEGVEDPNDSFWRRENEEYMEYWATQSQGRGNPSQHATPEWDRLQEDWERFEAGAAGIKPVSVYHFQPNNPYFLGESSTRNHAIHAHRLESNESVLEKEAAVQHNPRNAAAWFELGVKQQENEREPKAIQALQRAVELDPSYLAAWLALSISHTNENDKIGAYDAIENWVRNNERYDGAQLVAQLEKNSARTIGERNEDLIRCLVALARAAPEGEVDADIQTALGVLLNTNEEYEKAQDCFRTALEVRPNDWLLYNRVGATLANSGRANDALWYYYRALDLNPSYIRARFNLGISCINMKRYQEAAEHILDALSLQENDAFEDANTRGITSSTLWDCLRTTCVQLQRPDLTTICDMHDLDGFRKAFVDVV